MWQRLVTQKIIIYLHRKGSKYTSAFQFKTPQLDMYTQIKSLVLLADHTCNATEYIGLESVLQLNVNTQRKAENFERKLFERPFRH